jgi:hypothetical protein
VDFHGFSMVDLVDPATLWLDPDACCLTLFKMTDALEINDSV